MKNIGIQDLLVALIGLAALAWLVRRYVRAKRSGKACVSCPSGGSGACNCAGTEAAAPVMVQISGTTGPSPPRTRAGETR